MNILDTGNRYLGSHRQAASVFETLLSPNERLGVHARLEHRQLETGRPFEKHALCTDRRLLLISINGDDRSLAAESHFLRRISRLDRHTVLSDRKSFVDKMVIFFDNEEPITIEADRNA